MAKVVIRENESFDSLLGRFNKRAQQDGILSEVRRREHYEKHSVKRKRKKVTKKRESTKASRS